MDFQSMMETFAEAFVAATTQTPLTEAAADHQNLLLGLGGGGSSAGTTMDMSSNEVINRRLVATTTTPTSSGQSPILKNEEESISPAFAASNILELKEAISGNNVSRHIPLHCVVERVNPSLLSPGNSAPCSGSQGAVNSHCTSSSPSLNSNTSSAADLSLNSGTNTLNGASGSTPSSASPNGGNNSNTGTVIEQDTYAILSPSIPFNDIVRSVLTKLGYAPQEMVGAKALVQLRNWKPLTLDQINESVEATFGDIFGDISSFVTLRIRLFRPRMSAAHELKDKLLQVLLAHSYSMLANSGSPIDQQILSSLVRGGQNEQQDLNEDARRRDQWYIQQMFNQYRQFAMALQQQQQPMAIPGLRPNSASGPGAPSGASQLFLDLNLPNGTTPALAAAAGIHPSLAGTLAAAAAAASARPSANSTIGSNSSGNSEKHYGHKQSGSGSHHNSSGHHSSMTSSRTRIRTSFDPELELPKLHKWFAENRHPSRSQVQEYVKELNSLESRKGRKPLDVNNVVYWFKNARAAHKRAELKYITNENNPASHTFAYNQSNILSGDFFTNGGNHSPGKASSEASVSGKANDEPMSSASRNGSNMEDYYSFDEDGDSHEETQTLDLSVRNNVVNIQSKLFASSPDGVDIKQEEHEDADVLKILENDANSNSNPDNELAPNGIKSDMLEHSGRAGIDCGVSSDGNSIEEDSDEESETASGGVLVNNMAIGLNLSNLMSATSGNNHPESPEGRRIRRSRTFIDPMSEVPRLELWFSANTHPSQSQIVRYTDELNMMPYRQKFPKLEPKNIQFWFKNRRAKIKRTSGITSSAMSLSGVSPTVNTASTAASVVTSNTSLSSPSIHNSSALNIERLINAH